MNLNGDPVSDGLAAQVGGTGIEPGANIGAGAARSRRSAEPRRNMPVKKKEDPGSTCLPGEMAPRHPGWYEAAGAAAAFGDSVMWHV